MNSDGAIDGIIDDLSYIMPLIHKKILKVELERKDGVITRPHVGILAVLDKRGPQPISEIGKRLLIPKPQMTAFLDKLENLGLVARLSDLDDRRVIKVTLTDKGKESLEASKKIVRENLRQLLTRLDAGDLAELSASLSSARKIMTKLE